jgi:hypothetical protein
MPTGQLLRFSDNFPQGAALTALILICSHTVAPDLAACTRTKLTTPFVGPVNRDGSRTRIHAALVPAGVFFVRSSVLVINSAMIAGGSQVSPRGTGNHSEHVSTEGATACVSARDMNRMLNKQ